MQGTTIALVRYIEGHWRLRDDITSVSLIAYATNLTVYRSSDNAPLFSIPWGNFKSAYYDYTRKRGAASVGSTLISLIPVLDLTNAASSFYDGLTIKFWEEQIERDQRVFFATGSENKARKISQEIYRHRDHYQQQARATSRPERREPPASA